jgi:hypothetical protein
LFGTRYEYQPQITGVDDVEATATRARIVATDFEISERYKSPEH